MVTGLCIGGLILLVITGFCLLIKGGTNKCNGCGRHIPARYKFCSDCEEERDC